MAQQNQRKKVRIPEEVEYFSKRKFKKFKKKNKDYYDSKKELKEAYFSEILYDVPKVIEFLLRFSHIQSDEVKEIKSRCYEQFSGKPESPAFIKYITKLVKADGNEAIPNIEYFPIILHEIISDINRYNEEAKKENPEAEVFDASELYELSNVILKKKLKKAKKKGIDDAVAFDCLSVIPTEDAMKFSPYFRIKSVFEIMYLHAKTKQIDFKKMMDSYEDFFDEYIEFMKKYENSDDVAGMLNDYADYMTKYADYMQKLNDVDTDNLSTADAAYYTKVQARIVKKLAEIQ